jgi:hypothetical protein
MWCCWSCGKIMSLATKDYTWAAFVSMTVGWLAAVIGWALLWYFPPCGSWSTEVEVASFAFFSLPVALLAHILFIQLPSKYVKKVFFRITTIPFAIISAVYGVLLSAIAFNSFLFRDISAESFGCSPALIILIISAVNGFAFGLTFHSSWKPNQASA